MSARAERREGAPTDTPAALRRSMTAPWSMSHCAVSIFSVVYSGVSPSSSVMFTSPPGGIDERMGMRVVGVYLVGRDKRGRATVRTTLLHAWGCM